MRKHISDKEILIAVCDKEILGKTLKDNDVEIKIGDFYKGEEVTEEDLLSNVKKATIVNAIGERTISLFLKNNIINRENLIYISGIPHAQIYKMV
jgi:hypothetical protein